MTRNRMTRKQCLVLASSGREEAGGAAADQAPAIGSDPPASGGRARAVPPPRNIGSGGAPRASRRPSSKRGSAQMGRRVYELRVRGPVPAELLEEIGAEDFGEEPPLTILRTEPTDQPGLHGMLQRLRSLGLDLMEVRTTGPDPMEVGSTGPEPSDSSST